MLHHKGVKPILFGLIIALVAMGGLITIVGSGGGGGGSNPQGGARMQNTLRCNTGGNSTAVWTFGGLQMVSTNGQWSGCTFYSPGNYSANLRITVGRCGTWTANFNRGVVDGCTETLTFTVRNNVPVFNIARQCPGGCISVKSTDHETTTEEVAIELTQVEPGDGGSVFTE